MHLNEEIFAHPYLQANPHHRRGQQTQVDRRVHRLHVQPVGVGSELGR